MAMERSPSLHTVFTYGGEVLLLLLLWLKPQSHTPDQSYRCTPIWNFYLFFCDMHLYNTQYTQASVALICHFISKKEVGWSGLITKKLNYESTVEIFKLNLLLNYCYI